MTFAFSHSQNSDTDSAIDGPSSLPLLPFPAHLVRHGGRVLLPRAGAIVLPSGTDSLAEHDRRALLFWASQLRKDLATAGADGWRTRMPLPQSEAGPANKGQASATAGMKRPDGIILRLDSSLAEGVSKIVTQPRAPFCLLTARNLAALRNGIQTLRQLVRAAGLALPCLTISDSPAMRIRGFSLDVSRGRIPTLATLGTVLDVLELLKFNQFQLYVEAAVAFPDTMEAWRTSSPLTFDDIRRLDCMCRLRGIEFVPSLASFGHMYDILRTPRWRSLGEHPEEADRPFSFVERMRHHTLSPADPHSLEFSERHIDDYASLFSSHLFNIGGDETFDLGTGASASLARKTGIPHLYADFVGKLCTHLLKEDRTPIVYADIALKYPQLLPALPKGIVFANWDYAAHPNLENVRKVANSGHRQLVCPGVETWNRLLPDTDAAWSNISSLCQAGKAAGADGILVTDWGDYGHINDPVMSLPGIAFASECAWRQDPRPRKEVEETASRILFGDTTGRIISLVGQAARQQRFGWDDAVLWKELDSGNGRANPDTVAACGQPATLTNDVKAARTAFVATRCPTRTAVGEANRKLRDLVGTFSALPLHFARTLVTALDGQILLNNLGLALRGEMKAERKMTLSHNLDAWSLAFRRRWLAVSRPSRIDDVLHVLWKYADLLETGKI